MIAYAPTLAERIAVRLECGGCRRNAVRGGRAAPQDRAAMF
jgi:hypothetical protein